MSQIPGQVVQKIFSFIGDHLSNTTPLSHSNINVFLKMVSGGKSYNKFINTLKQYYYSECCRTTLVPYDVAYRCNTCAKVPAMTLCIECFDPAKHQGHDYGSYESSSMGGKCDCGDEEALDPAGFCNKATSKETQPPEGLLVPAALLLAPFVYKYVNILNGLDDETPIRCHKMSTVLREFAFHSSHLRKMICEILSKTQTNGNQSLTEKEAKYLEIINMWVNKVTIFQEIADDFRSKYRVLCKSNLLDVFYISYVKANFSDELNDFLLTLMSDKDFKFEVAKTFAKNFFLGVYITAFGFTNSPIDNFKNLGIQVLSCESYALDLYLNFHILHYILGRLYYLCLIEHHAEDMGVINFQMEPKTVAPANFMPMTLFLHAFLSNQNVSLEFIKDVFLQKLWIKILHLLMFSDKLSKNIDAGEIYDVHKSYFHHTAVMEIAMLPVWTIIPHIASEHKSWLLNFYQMIEPCLRDYAYQSCWTIHDISLHFPFHRTFSIILSTFLQKSYVNLSNFHFDREFLCQLMQAPMRAIAATYEMVEKLWERRHTDVRNQAKYYRHPYFSASTIDPDYFLIQLACSFIEPNLFVQYALENFQTLDTLDDDSDIYPYPYQRFNMLEEVLMFFASVLNTRVFSGENDNGLLRTEIVAIMAPGKLVHDDIIDKIPNRGSNWSTKLFNAKNIISKVGQLLPPILGNRSEPIEGKYILKDLVMLNEFDPLMTRLRSIYRSEYQDSLKKYYECVDRAKLNNKNIELWPPYNHPRKALMRELSGLERFLNCVSFHAFLFVILYKCYRLNYSDSFLHITIHLLNMSFSLPQLSKVLPCDENNLCTSCMVPFDLLYNVLDTDGLRVLFEHVNNSSNLSGQYNPMPEKSSDSQNERNKPFSARELYAYKSNAPRSTETILTYLLLLFFKHTKQTFKPVYMRGEGAKEYGSDRDKGPLVAGAEEYIGEVLDKLVKGSLEVRQYIEANTDDSFNDADEEAKLAERKRLVQAKKDKLKKKMQKKSQKALLLNADVEAELESSASTSAVAETETAEYIEDTSEFLTSLWQLREQPHDPPQCSSCHKEATMQEPLFLNILVTKTNLLGKRLSKENSVVSFRLEHTFAHNFDELNSAIKEVLPQQKFKRWYDTFWILSCGHYIHYECYESMMRDTLYRGQRTPTSFKNYEREFWCPVCNQLCNCLFPSSQSWKSQGPQILLLPHFNLINNILNSVSPASIEKTWNEVNVLFKNVAYESDFVEYDYYVNLLRNNIELYLMNQRVKAQQKIEAEERGDNAFKPPRKHFLNSVYNYCSSYIKNHNIKEIEDLVKALEIKIGENERNEKYNLAIIDIKHLLVSSLLLIDAPYFEMIKNVILFFLNVFLLQILTVLVAFGNRENILKIIEDENLAGSQIHFILIFLLENLDVNLFDSTKKAEKNFVKDFFVALYDFVKFCVVLHCSISFSNESTHKDIVLFDMWKLYGLLIGIDIESNNLTSIKCFGWDDKTLLYYLTKFCRHTNYILKVKPSCHLMRKILATDWKPPQLIALPKRFEDFYEADRKLPENLRYTKKNKIERCLICFNSFLHELELQHAFKCGRGTNVALCSTNNTMSIIWQNRSIYFESPYIDKHGQSYLLKKMQDLTLLKERYDYVQNMWLFNCFDIFAKNWSKIYL